MFEFKSRLQFTATEARRPKDRYAKDLRNATQDGRLIIAVNKQFIVIHLVISRTSMVDYMFVFNNTGVHAASASPTRRTTNDPTYNQWY
jgi:hypothetical protein